mmetsp:Transcript_63422/g.174532  ORF Transcript_63422/g.174532 Transcript_63422/m.174532 type:complete len:119 (-) Transcript_63422:391-747(-)
MPPSADTTPVPTPPLRTCIYSRRLQRLIDEARTASLPPKGERRHPNPHRRSSTASPLASHSPVAPFHTQHPVNLAAPTAAKKKRIKGLARKDDRVRLAKKSRVADKKKSRSKKFGMDD